MNDVVANKENAPVKELKIVGHWNAPNWDVGERKESGLLTDILYLEMERRLGNLSKSEMRERVRERVLLFLEDEETHPSAVGWGMEYNGDILHGEMVLTIRYREARA